MDRAWDVLGWLARSASTVIVPTRTEAAAPTPSSSFVAAAGDNNTRRDSSSRSGTTASKERSSGQQQQQHQELDLVELGVELTFRLLIAVTSGYLLMVLTKKFLGPILPENGDGEETTPSASIVYRRLGKILQKRGNSNSSKNNSAKVSIPALTPYERQMAQEVIDPDDIENSFADVGGLDDTKREIYELAILPLVRPHLFQGKLVAPCKGILLYGKPGTGKTMLAKALAKEAQAVFLPLQLSKILNKWVGESNKLVAATFSLANKLQPAIIFIDELDTFLKANNNETAYLDSIKAEFLTLWDGVSTSSNSQVLVLGATNKPHTIDPAILRRMPRAFHVPLPDQEGRLSILTLLFEGENISKDAIAFLPDLAAMTDGYSGSDLKELCKAAAMVPVQERTKEFARQRVMGCGSTNESGLSDDEGDENMKPLRPILKSDLTAALQKVKRTGAAATAYGRREHREQVTGDINPNSLRGLASLLRSLSALSTEEGDNDAIPEL